MRPTTVGEGVPRRVVMRRSWSSASRPGKRGLPERTSAKMQPRLQTSTDCGRIGEQTQREETEGQYRRQRWDRQQVCFGWRRMCTQTDTDIHCRVVLSCQTLSRATGIVEELEFRNQ